MLYKDKDRLIRYNYPKITVTREENQAYKLLKSKQLQKIQKVQNKDLKLEQYKH